VWDSRLFNNEYPGTADSVIYCIGTVSLIQGAGEYPYEAEQFNPLLDARGGRERSFPGRAKIGGSLNFDFVLE